MLLPHIFPHNNSVKWVGLKERDRVTGQSAFMIIICPTAFRDNKQRDKEYQMFESIRLLGNSLLLLIA